MRGKGFREYSQNQLIRITPAYAGKRVYLQVYFLQGRDHPRLCGEKTGTKYMWTLATGSPPPMRGKGAKTCDTVVNNKDHPRLCGEKQ